MGIFRGLSILRRLHRHGVIDLALEVAPSGMLRSLRGVLGIGADTTSPRGARLRVALESLGPIFVKFGQVLSTRRDLMPPDIADELAKLQDRVPPFDSRIARATIERAFGKSVEDIFVRFEEKPVASASIAQVHFGQLKLKSGEIKDVAIKVLRPGMLDVIEQDLSLMRTMAGWLESLSADGKRLKPKEVVAEFDGYLHDELDLVREAANATALRRNMQGLNLLLIPEMHWDYCATDVIVMQRMNGIPISQTDKLRALGVDMKQLAKDGVTIFFSQVFRDGFFHADMHPGNIQVSIEPETFGRYIALDFGIVGTLTPVDKDYLAQNFAAFFRRDYKRVAELHIESGWVPAKTRVGELESAIRACCEPHFDRPLKDISLGLVLMRLFQTSRRFEVEIQPQLVLLQKTLLNIEGLGRELDPDLDLWNTAKPFLEQWMREQIGPEKLMAELRDQAPAYAKLLPALPRLLNDALTQRGSATAVQTLVEENRKLQELVRTLLYVGTGLGVSVMWVLLVLYFRR